MKRTLTDYVKNNSNWHFETSKRSNDYKFVGNHSPIPQMELNNFIEDLQKSNLFKEITLGKRLKKYDNAEFYEVDEMSLWGYRDSVSFLNTIDIDKNKLEVPIFIQKLIDSFGLTNPDAALMVQHPGQMLPWHSDLYLSYRKKNNLKLSDNITRYLVAMSDWDWGHYFLCGNSVWHQWKAGDIITWEYLMYHCSSNCGIKPKITMSITGIR